MSQPPALIQELVTRFERNLDSYRSQGYNETQLRREFVDPFFEALGWDVVNKSGKAEAYKDVIHEDAISVGGFMKAPDYCFRIGGTRKFFLEAKKPSINLKEDTHPAYQLRRYAWSAKLPLSILTDFEEFAVYDCRTRPVATDKPAARRTLYLTYKDYLTRWDEISSVFSKDAIEKGSFDKYAVSERKRGTATVDAEFLAEIEGWREALAKTLALRNPKLSVHDLNFAVQRTIDRIVFLRICEDRAVEHYGQLQALLNAENIYGRLKQLYYQADDRYNSGLFHFQHEKGRAETPDEMTLSLKVDDKVLKDIIKGLYPPESPYEFSVFPAEILGQVYEQFLGKVIRLTAGHQAKVEEKPEVKKAGGIYYTPTYIVDYIVQHTVGKLCEGKTPKQIEKIHILDPACGSGSFLIGAYTYLLNCHREWYVKDGAEKHHKELFQTVGGEWRLTTQQKKRILLNNIYGVDVDSQAVEVTKLSLLLKVLEGESDETLKRQLSFVKERALPDLGSNIKCGNSLIGPDYFTGQLLPDEEAMRRINAFDWKAEFPEIMKAGGFDAVIGNPPYVLGRETFDETVKEYLASNYESFGGKYDLYIYFSDKAIDLLKQQGRFGFILPNTILVNVNAIKLRKRILGTACIENIKSFESRVFGKAQVENVILIMRKGSESGKNMVLIDAEKPLRIPQSTFSQLSDFRLNINIDPHDQRLAEKIEKLSTPLGDVSDICIGIQLGGSTGKQRKESFLSTKRKDITYKRVLDGRDINRYEKNWNGVYVHYGPWLHRKRKEKYFLTPKVMIRQIGATPIASYDEDNFYTLNTIYNLVVLGGYSPKYVLGIINSTLGRWFWEKRNSDFKTIFPKIKKSQIADVPIRSVDLSASAAKHKHDQVVALVERMLDLHNRRAAAKTPDDKTRLQRQIDATDLEIDRLVYDLYGLTEDEINVVEGQKRESD